MTALAINNPSYDLLARTYNTGAGAEAHTIQEILSDTINHLRKPASWDHVRKAIGETRLIFENYSTDNWDGYGAAAIKKAASDDAFKFISAFPLTLPMPEISPESDGSIALDWYRGKNWVFSISLDGRGVITYAGLFGKGVKAHGTEIFSDTIPKDIVNYISRITRKQRG